MPRHRFLPVTIALSILLALSAGLSAAQGPAPQDAGPLQTMLGSAFTYQGQLQKDGVLVNATCTMVFSLYDDATAGSQVGDPITLTVAVANGLFTAVLNSAGEFGTMAFAGDARWLEVAVQCPGDPGFNTLTPRQELTAAPYALSLRPGALVEGDIDGHVLRAINQGSGDGLYGQSYSTSNAHGVTGLASATSGTTYGVYGRSYSPDGYGVFGWNAAGNGTANGVYGRSDSNGGVGVYGEATATSGTTYGVYATSHSPSGAGVYGLSTATTGGGPDFAYGVYGQSYAPSGRGVYGWASATSGVTFGIYGQSDSTTGRGVLGWATATSGDTIGVFGSSESPTGRAVYGYAHASTGESYGVYGEALSPDGRGVYGKAVDGYGVYATAAGGYGVYAEATGGMGVYGNGSVVGVHGDASATMGTAYGVSGYVVSTDGSGVYGQGPHIGVLGGCGAPDGYGVYASGNFGATGTKAAIVPTQAYGWRHLYSVESPDVLFEDVGTAQLVDGQAVVPIDPVFAQTVNLEQPYQVFVTANSEDTVILSVAAKGPTSFTVHGATLDGRPATCAFDYRIIAKRLGYEDVRLAPAADPTLMGGATLPLAAPEEQP